MTASCTRAASVSGPRGERGSAAVEYVVLVGVAALLALHAFTVFGTDASNTVRDQGADVGKLGF